MERGLGSDSVPPQGSFDKSKVLDVRPLCGQLGIPKRTPLTCSFSAPRGSQLQEGRVVWEKKREERGKMVG